MGHLCSFCDVSSSASASEAEGRAVGLPAFNESAVDFTFSAIGDLLLGPDTFWQSLTLVFTFQALRSIGTAVSGLLYYWLLGVTDGEARDRLEQLDFAFSEQTFLNDVVANFVVWAVFAVGRIVLTLAAHGRIPAPPSLESLFGLVSRPAPVRVFLVRFFFEWVGMHLGFLTLVAVGNAVYGDGRKRRRKKREESGVDLGRSFERSYIKILSNIETL